MALVDHSSNFKIRQAERRAKRRLRLEETIARKKEEGKKAKEEADKAGAIPLSQLAKELPIIKSPRARGSRKTAEAPPAPTKPETPVSDRPRGSLGTFPGGVATASGELVDSTNDLMTRFHDMAIKVILKAKDDGRIRQADWAVLRYCAFLWGGSNRERHFVKWVLMHTPLVWKEDAINSAGKVVGAFTFPEEMGSIKWEMDWLTANPFWTWELPKNEGSHKKKSS